MTIETVRTVAELRRTIYQWRAEGLSVGLVPTMGALHAGHLSLVAKALQQCDRVCVTLFVNPTQFGEGEDFKSYPRDENADGEMLSQAGAHLLYAPDVDEMYPDGTTATTEVNVGPLGDVLEGASRPGHFSGVATIVSKLLLQAMPDKAYFGEKDFQQLMVIRQLVVDLAIAVEVVGVAIMRETDGLAMSSRNAYLSADERAAAPVLNSAVIYVATGFRSGSEPSALIAKGETDWLAAGFSTVDYIAVVDSASLNPISDFDPARPARVLVAATLGRARLIDNISVQES